MKRLSLILILTLISLIAFGQSNFESFLERFSKNKAFQLEHIIFPVTSVYLSENGEDEITKKISISNWVHQDLSYDSSAFYREYDQYIRKINTKNSEVEVEFRGIDNGINFGYIFIYQQHSWYLKRYYDLSF